MRKIAVMPMLVVLVIAVVACGGPTATPTVAPEPTPEPTEVPAEKTATEETATTGAEEVTTREKSGTEGAESDLMAYQALAVQNSARAMDVMSDECPPGSTTFPVPDPDTNTKRPLDFTPFDDAMAEFTAEQAATMDAALAGKTLPEIQELLNGGDFTSEQLILYYLDRIHRYDVDKLNSVMELNPEALAIAQERDAERSGGTTRGNLHGIPVLLKDNIATGDQMHTTAGNYALKDWQADRDAFLVQQLREAGAIILGKANLSEWANYTDPCMPNGFSANGGQVRHPWGPYDPLGSSTGSAVSVAANLSPVSVGSETSGSLTQPARSSGVVGMRPSQGVISGDYVVPLESNLDTAGPMGHSVTDVAILLTAMAGTDANDPKTTDATALAGTDFVQYLSVEEAQKPKVGVVQFDLTAIQTLEAGGQSPSEEEIEALTPEEWQQLSDLYAAPAFGGATQETIDALASQGIEVVLIKESQLPPYVPNGESGLLNFGFQNSVNAFLTGLGDSAPISSLAEAVDIVNEDPANRAPYGQRYVEWSVNTETTAEEYEAAVRGGEGYSTEWMQWFTDTHDVDVILMGALYQSAGLADIPALTIPTGQATDESGQPGQPTGVVLSGPYLSDAQLIAVGYALEQALNVHLEPDLDATIQQIESVTGQ